MRELPKFVVERLKESVLVAGHHPDADVLTAFAERSLPTSERAVVLEHLARCGDCRDVVALALPATEVVDLAGASAGRRSRWQWHVLRPAAVAAAIITAVAVGIFRYQHREPANVIIARNVEQKQIAASPTPNEMEKAAPRQETVSPSAETRREAAPPQSRSSAGKPPSSAADALGWRTKTTGMAAGASGGVGAAGLAQGTKMAMAEPPRDLAFASSTRAPSAPTKKQIPEPSLARRDAPPATSQSVEVQNQEQAVTVQSQSLDTQTAELQAPAESTEDKVRRAKPAATIGGPVVAPSATPQADSPMLARNQLDLRQDYQTPTQHWTISSTGRLLRSLDGGETWQDVNVTARPGLYRSMPVAVASRSQAAKAVAKDTADDKEKKTKAGSASSPVFRAVAAIGNEVWAGASGGLLYHSTDGGTLWTSIVPSAQGVTLSGDIIRVEFSDVLHGKITTSTSETWTTADAGQSWQKQ
jgi:hypothetical protein